MQSPNLILLSDQNVLRRAIDVVANNVANANTTGFKRIGIEFDTLVAQPQIGQRINFVVDRATYRDPSNGPIQPTGNQLDLAISGPGYFQVQTPEGTRYTRGGSLQLDQLGQISTLSGHPVLGDGGQPISIPDTATDINISSDGYITAKTDNGTALAEFGKVAIVKFDNEQLMQPQGAGLYATSQTATPASPATGSAIVQGAVEQSNVQPVTEITQMIKIMRSYEQTAALIRQEEQRQSDAINKLSRTTA